MAPGEHTFHPHDSVSAAINGTMITGGAGLFISAIQNTLTRQNTTPWGVFTRSGSSVAVFAAMGGTYEFARYASANIREKDDTYNTAFGGFLAGSILGLRGGSMPSVLGFGALSAVVLAAFDYTGGSLKGTKQKDSEEDEFERKQFLRKNRRRPIEETIAEVGEGRGVYAPGYEGRRRERIKATYGIDIPEKAT